MTLCCSKKGKEQCECRGSTSNPAKESQERLPGGGDIRAVSFSIGVRLGEKKIRTYSKSSQWEEWGFRKFRASSEVGSSAQIRLMPCVWGVEGSRKKASVDPRERQLGKQSNSSTTSAMTPRHEWHKLRDSEESNGGQKVNQLEPRGGASFYPGQTAQTRDSAVGQCIWSHCLPGCWDPGTGSPEDGLVLLLGTSGTQHVPKALPWAMISQGVKVPLRTEDNTD